MAALNPSSDARKTHLISFSDKLEAVLAIVHLVIFVDHYFSVFKQMERDLNMCFQIKQQKYHKFYVSVICSKKLRATFLFEVLSIEMSIFF